MFKFTGKASDAPQFTWNEDGSRCEMLIELDELNIQIKPGEAGKTFIAIDFARFMAFAAWAKMDPALVQDLNRMARTGEPTELMREVRSALGLPDDDH